MQLSVRVGLIGCGTVGANVASRLLERQERICEMTGVRYDLTRIAVRNLDRKRVTSLPPELLCTDARSIARDPGVDIVIECAGRGDEIGEAVECALERGAHVITANKDLIAMEGPRLLAIARTCGGTLSYEAAVCGAIPIVRVLRESLAADEILSIAGVFNGTTTVILSAIEAGASYAQALAHAQEQGYAEADPGSDISGMDAGHKLALLIQLGFGLGAVTSQIAIEGLRPGIERDVAHALALGYRLRLVACAASSASGLAAGVAPVLVPCDHPFAQTSGPRNVARVLARDAGELTFSGAGAGGAATANSVLADFVSVLRSIGKHASTSRTRHELAAPPQIASYFTAAPRHRALPQYRVWSDASPSDDTFRIRRGGRRALEAQIL
jgi:homoserine dehydrogenase